MTADEVRAARSLATWRIAAAGGWAVAILSVLRAWGLV